jgi:hypothetical protein
MQDRAFRIGQKRDVMVFRLIATGTLDELIYMRQMCAHEASQLCVVCLCAASALELPSLDELQSKL